MKHFIATIFFLLITVNTYCQSREYKNIRLNDSLYIDVAPVDNIMFSEYTDYHQYYSTSKVDSILNHSKAYGLDRKTIFGENIKLKDLRYHPDIQNDAFKYSRHPDNRYFPAIYVSIQQAKDFCEWRTKATLLYFAMNSKSQKERNKYPKKIKFRLPTFEELNLALETFGYSKGYKISDKSIPFLSYKKKYKSKYTKAIFIENNLSEYTLDSLSFGTNWSNKKNFNTPNKYTSFRCVCEIIE